MEHNKNNGNPKHGTKTHNNETSNKNVLNKSNENIVVLWNKQQPLSCCR